MKFKMGENKLPIDKMLFEERIELRRGLDKKILSEETIQQIKELFDLDLMNTKTVEVCCDESHCHYYECLRFNNSYSEVVLRLLNEIERYKSVLDSIREKADYRE